MTAKMLVLDNNKDVLHMLKAAFAKTDFDLLLESDSDAALRRVVTDHPNVAIIDIGLPDRSGLEVLQEAKRMDPGLAVIMATGCRTTEHAIEAMKCGAFDYVTKPFDAGKLRAAAERALECNLLSRKVRYSKDNTQVGDSEIGDDIMIGSSPEMMEIWKMVGTVANSDATVLIQGESGTGKELLARAIYNNSSRKNRPFLAVNCAALPEALLESELFGHEKGAFTDAHTRRIGKFEQCNGGTIFLDEIGEMSLANQGKFLRVLENQEFERVGGNDAVKVDVRVIAATNKSLISCVKEKTFRLDLYYRLRVVSFYLPPLRDRTEDIPFLVDLFVKKFSRKYHKVIKGVSREAMALLTDNVWEGNIRELKNAINSAIVCCRGDVLGPADFQSFTGAKVGFKEVDLGGTGDDYFEAFCGLLEQVFDGICRKNKGSIYESVNMGLEKALIRMAMQKSNNNQVFAAKLLGISRTTLRDRLERYRISATA